MPSLIPVLCNMPRAQKDTLGCEDSTKPKHCANHVNLMLTILKCPEKVSIHSKKTLSLNWYACPIEEVASNCSNTEYGNFIKDIASIDGNGMAMQSE
jgi:hypothetical protein